jgi:hypothetical protein
LLQPYGSKLERLRYLIRTEKAGSQTVVTIILITIKPRIFHQALNYEISCTVNCNPICFINLNAQIQINGDKISDDPKPYIGKQVTVLNLWYSSADQKGYYKSTLRAVEGYRL